MGEEQMSVAEGTQWALSVERVECSGDYCAK